jgi:ATP adenylyltransferase
LWYHLIKLASYLEGQQMDPILWTPWRMPYLRGEDREQYDGCLFCIKGQGDASDPNFDTKEYVVARGEHVYMVLNRYPYNNGHTLIVPYAHVPSVEKLSAEALTDMMQMLNRTMAALRSIYHPDAFNVGMNIGASAGAGIPDHVHMHVVPRWNADTNFMTVMGGARIIPELLDETYRLLREAWED